MIDRYVLVAALLLLFAGLARAQDSDEGGCVYDRQIYPEGYEMCQSGQLKRCEDGAWGDIGLCKAEAMPPPGSEEGDVEIDADE